MNATPNESEAPTPKSTFYQWMFFVGLAWCVGSWVVRATSGRPYDLLFFPMYLSRFGELGLVVSFVAGMAIAGTGFGRSDFLRNDKHAVLRVAMYTGLGIHALAMAIWIPLFGLETGSRIRPMGQSVLLFGLAGCGFFFCVIPAMISLFRGGHRFAGIACGLLGITPFFTGLMTLGIAIEIRGLEMLH
jgi:hypothetical protein